MTVVLPKTTTASSDASSRASFLFASLATTLAGFLDAVGYNKLNHLYVSFMSGNSTHLGMSLAVGSWGDVTSAALLIFTFVAGTIAGTLILDAAARPLLAILAGELLLCAVGLVLVIAGMAEFALTLIALMMGMQNVIHQNINGTDAGKGFITGALFGLGQSLARVFRGKESLVKAGVYASTWLFFILGVLCGTLSIDGWGLTASLSISLANLGVLIVLTLGTDVGGSHGDRTFG